MMRYEMAVQKINERAIICPAWEVQSILAGRLLLLIRPIVPVQSEPKIPPRTIEPWVINGEQEADDDGLPCWIGTHPDYPTEHGKWFSCPWGMEGWRLWVRETWINNWGTQLLYRASCEPDSYEYGAKGWRSPATMPRYASRITLAVTGVRAMLIHRLGEESAKATGVGPEWVVSVDRGDSYQSHGAAFIRLWDARYGRRYPWDSNPAVWGIGVRRIEG
jgi:hypothetical protein